MRPLFLLAGLALALSACAPSRTPTIAPTLPVAYRTSTPQTGPVAIPYQNPPDASSPLVLSHPSLDAQPIASQLEMGEGALIVGRDASGEWWQVEVHGELGWLPASQVGVMGDVAGIPIVRTP